MAGILALGRGSNSNRDAIPPLLSRWATEAFPLPSRGIVHRSQWQAAPDHEQSHALPCIHQIGLLVCSPVTEPYRMDHTLLAFYVGSPSYRRLPS